ATVLRAAGIYGPMRGLHRRILDGEFRIPGTGANVVSRIHVEDLATWILAALASGERARGRVFVAADAAPVPQIEVIRWLAGELGVPVPPSVELSEAAPTLRHDRAADSRAIREALAVGLRYPSYKEGFARCLAVERASR